MQMLCRCLSMAGALERLAHVEWRAQWKISMLKPQNQFLAAVLSLGGPAYFPCPLCASAHGFEHCTGPKHYNHVWELKSNPVSRGLGVE